ncbi:cyclic nucleotide-binding domain-containing protein [Myxococcus sp. AM009]|uniref:cyclic nucleotide-binding domain-containing protein n=1 Tax=unclassified Myxococcus TaxID=2648731 RepID=UPI0015959D36|nr:MULTISPECIES: cyclic nucleotide-binding domain-containing protein [unclassified Myxococcus]NVI99164.1 cyclic nucleotide-binding domain-containing protein [Myxococcus sp. AM009]NVJ15599.1 cyclic nucleotide-binding domain-containing protein [Myxococcus sp. AM010]
MELRKLKDKASEAFTKGRFSKAAELYEDYCRAEPKDHQSRLRSGDAWVKAGQRDRAISAYQSAAEGFAREGFLPRAIAASKLILELDPAHRGVQQMLADLYARRGTPMGVRARGPMSNASSVTVKASAEPPGTSRLPAAVRAAVAAIDLGEDEAAGGSSADLSAELPPARVLSTDASSRDTEEVVHSVEVGLASEEGTAGVEVTLDVEPVVAGERVDDAVALPEPEAPPLATRIPAVQPGGARAATSSLPPGLAPRASQRLPAVGAARAPEPAPAAPPRSVSNSGRWQALSSPITTQPEAPTASDAAASSSPPGLRPRRADAPVPAGATALPGHDLSPALGASFRTATSPSSFTELELEADSLLHAVELAAQAALSRQGLGATSISDGLEEEIYSLTEEVPPEATSLDALPTIPLFSDLPRDAFIELFERCPLRRFGPGERIIDQGSHGDAFYVICEGAVRVFRTEDGQRHDLATLEGGAFFGEMALLSGAARTASVESASDDSQLLEISAGVLAELSRSHPQVALALKKFCRQRMLTNVMNTSKLFRLFERKDRRDLVERFRSRDVERDAVVIRDGDPTDGLYVVLSGEVEVRKDGHLLTQLREGEVFGEISLLQKTPATATVTATRHTTLLRLPRADFDALISSHPQILALISDLSDERLRRTQRVLTEAGVEEDLILV